LSREQNEIKIVLVSTIIVPPKIFQKYFNNQNQKNEKLEKLFVPRRTLRLVVRGLQK
jgi:hypothetical protein